MTTTSTRTDRKLCHHCEATPAGCDSRMILSGGPCCPSCTGNHETGRGVEIASGIDARTSPQVESHLPPVIAGGSRASDGSDRG